jgi:hypothetical protein
LNTRTPLLVRIRSSVGTNDCRTLCTTQFCRRGRRRH